MQLGLFHYKDIDFSPAASNKLPVSEKVTHLCKRRNTYITVKELIMGFSCYLDPAKNCKNKEMQ